MHFYYIIQEISYYCIKTVKKSNRDFSLPPLSAYAKIISSFTISLAQALMLLSRPVHSKAFSSFKRCVLFHALYKPFKAFLRLPVDVGKIGIEPATCENLLSFSCPIFIIELTVSASTLCVLINRHLYFSFRYTVSIAVLFP